MKKYKVTLQRAIQYTAVVEDVEASSALEAVAKAGEIADAPKSKLWREGDVVEDFGNAVPQS